MEILEGKVEKITGAERGVGRVKALMLIRHGAKTVFCRLYLINQILFEAINCE